MTATALRRGREIEDRRTIVIKASLTDAYLTKGVNPLTMLRDTPSPLLSSPLFS
jgi:hypothetical protein